MKNKKKPKTILCFEGEWRYNSQPRENRFDLNSEPMLRMLMEYHKCNVVYRHILKKEDLQYFFDFFNNNKSERSKFVIIYFACHGSTHALSLEGVDGNIDLKTLAEMAGDFFQDKIVHFSSCKTMANRSAVENFKNETGATLVCGYKVSVDAIESIIADTALLNELMKLKNAGSIKNETSSKFRKKYKSLLENLQFDAV